MSDPKTNQQFTDDEIAKLTYEQAVERLEELVDRIESGEVSLESTVQAYEEGVKLKAHCESLLSRAEQRVEAIKADDLASDEAESGSDE